MPDISTRFEYIAWAAKNWLGSDKSCPACGTENATRIKRKYLVTALYRCEQCRLMFRVPKTSSAESHEFYQEQYREGFTTDCPKDEELTRLKQESFKGTEKDYSTYLDVFSALGLRRGQVVLDFGSSWGYGSWQFKQAGYRVYSYEISQNRARYASEKLGCSMVAEISHTPEKVDCFFSAHVLEHLPNPKVLWRSALEVLKPDGLLVLFMPNGEPSREQVHTDYHKLWGQTHPLLLTAESLGAMAKRYGFVGNAYSSPYDLSKVSNGDSGSLNGEELLFVGKLHGSSIATPNFPVDQAK